MFKKLLISLTTTLLGVSAMMAETAPVSLKWIMGENDAAPDRYSVRVVIKNVSNKPLDKNWYVAFNHFDRKMEAQGDAQIAIKAVPPNYFMFVPTEKYKDIAPGDSIVTDFLFGGFFLSVGYYPDGAHFVANGDIDHPIGMEIEFPVMNNPKQWTSEKRKIKNYPDGNYVYALNSSINPSGAKLEGSMYDQVFPEPKVINLTGGTTKLPENVTLSVKAEGLEKAQKYAVDKLAANGIKTSTTAKFKITLGLIDEDEEGDEYYELDVTKNGVAINGNSAIGVLNGVKTLIAVIEQNGGKNIELENVSIEDSPDLAHRGMMLDIGRNYTKLKDVKFLLDILASYKINIFHFHIAEDEAWRLEIPGLPELTSVGARKGADILERESLLQTYDGDGNPNSDKYSANGYITRQEFIDLLKYADGLGIEIIPEVDTPGHSRAAIYSMKNRYRKYINTNPAEAERYRLWDDQDTSKYYSAQGYGDDVFNVASEGTYNFMNKVFDEIKAMYDEAGLTLRIYHIGGDEVAHGAWEGSPEVQALMKEKGMSSIREVQEYYFDRVSEYIASKGVLVGCWQEAALNHSEKYNERVAPRLGMVNAWSTNGGAARVPYTLANNGYPVVMSNVGNFYLDMAYSRHQCEDGLVWSGWCDEFSSFNAQPFNTYRSARLNINGGVVDLATAADGKPELKDKSMIKGVQAQLWAETIRNFDMVQMYVLPKILGMVERGWNAYPVWGNDYTDFTRYNAARAQYNLRIGLLELPRLNRKGANFHINQPGIIVEDGMLKANACYPGVVVRYTLDGSEPTAKSAVWTAPVPCGDAKLIKAKAYYLGKESVTTFLFR